MVLPYFTNLLWHHQVVPKDVLPSLSRVYSSPFCIAFPICCFPTFSAVWGPWWVLGVGTLAIAWATLKTYYLNIGTRKYYHLQLASEHRRRLPTIAFLCFQESGLEHPCVHFNHTEYEKALVCQGLSMGPDGPRLGLFNFISNIGWVLGVVQS